MLKNFGCTLLVAKSTKMQGQNQRAKENNYILTIICNVISYQLLNYWKSKD